eukprot:TRINITY_DN35150_c0_g1_i1.p1 TRINITY_DN35150_c0_g1~~TRINITY_DN35150_c0_g1_i1.p1  ORF type:complete len:356 (+),score=72.42 TRINITY_DN35150_c0_g1_i1:77-1069(+)
MSRILIAFFALLSLVAAETCTSYDASGADGPVLYFEDTSFTEGIQSFVFDLESGSLDFNDTSATLSGRLLPSSATTQDDGFYLVISLQHDSEPYQGWASNPNLLAEATSSFSFYIVAGPSYLSGFGKFNGFELPITQRMESAPLQIGTGANGKNLNMGAGLWINVWNSFEHVQANINIDLNCTSSSPPSTIPSSSSSDDTPTPSGCSVSVTKAIRNTWSENGRSAAVVEFTILNTGTLPVLDAVVHFNYGGASCAASSSSSGQTCLRQLWNLAVPSGLPSNSNYDSAATCLHLPDWVTRYGGLGVSKSQVFGVITYASNMEAVITPTCTL